MLYVQEWSAEMWVPRNLKVVTVSTCSPFMRRGVWSCLFFVKSMMSYFVFWTYRVRLLSEHHSDSSSTSALFAVSSSPRMSPTTVVSSAYSIMRLGVQ